MDEFPFDDTATDDLLDGKVPPASAPDGFQQLAALIQVATVTSPVERAAERATVSAMGSIIRGEVSGGGTRAGGFGSRRRAQLARAATIAAFVALSGGAVAAAAGALPDPVQRVVAGGFSGVGISVPEPHSHPTTPTTTTTTTSTTVRRSAGAKGITHSAHGLCTAYRAAEKQAAATAFERLATAAKAHDLTVAGYCDVVLAPPVTEPHPSTPPVTHPSPPVSVPGNGGTAPGKGHDSSPGPSSSGSTGTGHDSSGSGSGGDGKGSSGGGSKSGKGD